MFYGDPLDFDDWKCDLNATFSSMCIEEAEEKIRHLKKYVNGEAEAVL